MSEATPRGAESPIITIEYYTDPLCSWSWGFEPQWRRLRYEFGSQLTWWYRMGGLIPTWEQYSDPMNDVHRPVQMGPQWAQVHHLTGMPLDGQIWMDDPPASSYPACLAFHAAARQSPQVAEVYLRRLREAVMCERRNIARQEVLLALAQEVAEQAPEVLDTTRFAQDLNDPQTREAFRQDLSEARYRDIGRFPALILRRGDNGRGVIIVGYRPYGVLLDALGHLAPEVQPVRSSASQADYEEHWPGLTRRELDEVLTPNAAGPMPTQ